MPVVSLQATFGVCSKQCGRSTAAETPFRAPSWNFQVNGLTLIQQQSVLQSNQPTNTWKLLPRTFSSTSPIYSCRCNPPVSTFRRQGPSARSTSTNSYVLRPTNRIALRSTVSDPNHITSFTTHARQPESPEPLGREQQIYRPFVPNSDDEDQRQISTNSQPQRRFLSNEPVRVRARSRSPAHTQLQESSSSNSFQLEARRPNNQFVARNDPFYEPRIQQARPREPTFINSHLPETRDISLTQPGTGFVERSGPFASRRQQLQNTGAGFSQSGTATQQQPWRSQHSYDDSRREFQRFDFSAEPVRNRSRSRSPIGSQRQESASSTSLVLRSEASNSDSQIYSHSQQIPPRPSQSEIIRHRQRSQGVEPGSSFTGEFRNQPQRQGLPPFQQESEWSFLPAFTPGRRQSPSRIPENQGDTFLVSRQSETGGRGQARRVNSSSSESEQEPGIHLRPVSQETQPRRHQEIFRNPNATTTTIRQPEPEINLEAISFVLHNNTLPMEMITAILNKLESFGYELLSTNIISATEAVWTLKTPGIPAVGVRGQFPFSSDQSQ